MWVDKSCCQQLKLLSARTNTQPLIFSGFEEFLEGCMRYRWVTVYSTMFWTCANLRLLWVPGVVAQGLDMHIVLRRKLKQNAFPWCCLVKKWRPENPQCFRKKRLSVGCFVECPVFTFWLRRAIPKLGCCLARETKRRRENKTDETNEQTSNAEACKRQFSIFRTRWKLEIRHSVWFSRFP